MVNLISLLEKTNEQFEMLTIHEDRCLHQLSSKSQCSRCMDQCPGDAITLTNGIIAVDSCLSCAQCVKHCPVDVFMWKSPSYEQIDEQFKETIAKAESLILSCSGAPLQLPEAPVLHIPSFAYLLDEIWMYLLERDNFSVYLPEGACGNCDKHCDFPQAAEGIRLKDMNQVKELIHGKESYDRQKRQSIFSMFRFIKQTGMNAANLESQTISTGEMKKMWKMKISDSSQTGLFNDHAYAEILPTCKDCRACSMLCPEKAIQTVEQGNDQPRTVIDASTCTACGLCVDICYFNAVQLTQSAVIK